ncbi:MAG: symmetrical bis(5'-nucleosyl)-tetraphosphatase [Gammaproteobacteria bacterium]|nr:symmetrical bis(5'-nucleosyl)-tetraphosphatase [Gammaproteobacteria bacterium]
MATYAVGDVQGCAAELEALLGRLAFSASRDRLWFVGDLVNRGPRSLDVLRLVRDLGDAAVVVLGNHDLHLLAVARGHAELRGTDETLQQVLEAPDRDRLLDWLQARPVLHHDAALGITMIHAGLPPQWDIGLARRCAAELEQALGSDRSGKLFARMYGNQPDLWRDDLDGIDRLRFITNALTRLRACDAEGRMLLKLKGPIEQLPAGAVPWFRAPRRRSAGARIVCGHWSALGYCDEAGVLSIDTGCVWGGTLAAQRLDAPATPVFVPSTMPAADFSSA